MPLPVLKVHIVGFRETADTVYDESGGVCLWVLAERRENGT